MAKPFSCFIRKLPPLPFSFDHCRKLLLVMYEIIDKVIGHQYNLFTYHAGMAELADALDLGSSV